MNDEQKKNIVQSYLDMGYNLMLIRKSDEQKTAEMTSNEVDAFIEIANEMINSGMLKDGSVTNLKIADATIESAKIVSLDADQINAGTLVGFTMKTSGLTTGKNTIIDGATNSIKWLYNNDEKGTILVGDDGFMLISSDEQLNVQIGGDILMGGGLISIQATKDLQLIGDDIVLGYNDDNDGSDLYFASNAVTKAQLTSSGNFIVVGTIQAQGGYISADGTSGKSSGTYGFVTAGRINDGSFQGKWREITIKNGLITSVSSESGWQ